MTGNAGRVQRFFGTTIGKLFPAGFTKPFTGTHGDPAGHASAGFWSGNIFLIRTSPKFLHDLMCLFLFACWDRDADFKRSQNIKSDQTDCIKENSSIGGLLSVPFVNLTLSILIMNEENG